MDQGGGWFSNVSGPSPDLEAVWGPDATQPSHRLSDAGDDPSFVAAPLDPSAPVVASLIAPSRRRRPVSLVAGGVAVVVVAAVAGLSLAGGHGDERTVSAASDTTTVPPVSDEQADNAKAFLERWNAGPSTTMPLGEAGVPPEERPTTTTTTTTWAVSSASPRVRSTPTTVPPWVDDDPQQSTPTLAADDPRLAGAEQAARDFVDAMQRRDCDAVWSAFSTRTRAFFEDMADEGESVKDDFCMSLREEDIPPITVRGPARPYEDGAVVTLESNGETDEIVMVLEGDRWTVDLLGAIGAAPEGDGDGGTTD